MDEEDVIYNLEAQRKNTKNLPKRSRLYQGIIDSKLLPVGAFDFNEMNDVIIIMITPLNEDLEVKYMQTWEEKAMEREAGRRETKREIIEKMRESLSVKEIAQLLGMEEDAVKNTLNEKEIEPE